MKEISFVLTSVSGEGEAGEIASRLVERGLAACVSVVPAVRSIYRWRGNICDDRESLLIIKTTADLFEKVEEEIKKSHSYELPEIVALAVPKGSVDYLRWIAEQVGG